MLLCPLLAATCSSVSPCQRRQRHDSPVLWRAEDSRGRGGCAEGAGEGRGGEDRHVVIDEELWPVFKARGAGLGVGIVSGNPARIESLLHSLGLSKPCRLVNALDLLLIG